MLINRFFLNFQLFNFIDLVFQNTSVNMDIEAQDKKKKHETESAADLERVTGEMILL